VSAARFTDEQKLDSSFRLNDERRAKALDSRFRWNDGVKVCRATLTPTLSRGRQRDNVFAA
jgi:hypothetical protein